jgi:XisI protein
MDTVSNIVREEIAWYAGSGRGANILLFPILDDERKIYSVISLDYPERTGSGIVVLARIIGDQVVIEVDNTDRSLSQSLLQRGIPRAQIVLAYSGEPIPDAEQFELDR